MPTELVARNVDWTRTADRRRATLVVGPRQAGKSTWVWSILRDRDPVELLYVDAEEPLIRSWATSAHQVLADLDAEFPAVRTLFFDEVQHLAEAGLFIKQLIDSGRQFEILVTGSSSFHLGAKTRESLAGRATRIKLLPLSLTEIVTHARPASPAAERELSRRALERQAVLGGYPSVWLGDEPERELGELVEAFVLRDASDRFRIARPDAFRRILQLTAGQIGQMANFSEWAAITGVSASTVREYVSLMEESWLVRLLPAFAGGKRREITSAPRVHLFDMGLRNALLGALSSDLALRPDRGSLLEGWAFGELEKSLPRGWSLHYWRAKGGAEVDFVMIYGDRRIAVEIKGTASRGISRSARSFIDAYAPEAFVITGADETREDVAEGTRILFVPTAELARVVRSLVG